MQEDRTSAGLGPKDFGISPVIEHEFLFRLISNFDARRGLNRCRLPGVGVVLGRSPRAIADFWWKDHLALLVRLSCRDWRSSFHVIRADGGEAQDAQLEALEEVVVAILQAWLLDGADDEPDVPLAPEDGEQTLKS